MTAWTPDPRTEKHFGPFAMVSLRGKGTSETAHLVSFPDGRSLRVLPDGHTTGLRRSRAISHALRALEDVWETMPECQHDELPEHPELDPAVYVIGMLSAAGADQYGYVDERPSVEEWLDAWLSVELGVSRSRGFSEILIRELSDAGWEIVRRDAE